jgi:non-ribosomal peptide synthetase component F
MEYWSTIRLVDARSSNRPAARARPTPRPNRRSRIVSQALVDRLHAFGRGEQATMFMLLASGSAAMLARFARQEEIVIGTPVAGRGSSGAEGLIGPFANMIVLRADVSGNPTFRELVARIKRDAIGAYAHQAVPFERVVDALGVDRDPDRPPAFQAFLNYRNLPPRRHPSRPSTSANLHRSG